MIWRCRSTSRRLAGRALVESPASPPQRPLPKRVVGKRAIQTAQQPAPAGPHSTFGRTIHRPGNPLHRSDSARSLAARMPEICASANGDDASNACAQPPSQRAFDCDDDASATAPTVRADRHVLAAQSPQRAPDTRIGVACSARRRLRQSHRYGRFPDGSKARLQKPQCLSGGGLCKSHQMAAMHDS